MFGPGYNQIKILQFDDTFQMRHGCFVEVFPHLVTDKEHSCFRMVYDVMDIVCLEFVENRNGNGSVGDDTQEGGSPVGAVAAAKCYFIPWLDSCMLEQDMHFFYFPCYVFIL